MSGRENHRKKGPAQPDLARQVDPIHNAGKPDIRKDQCTVSPADEHRGKGSFGAFTLDGIEFTVFKQPRRELAQFGVVLDDQHRSTILLGLSHIYAPPLSVRYDPRPIAA